MTQRIGSRIPITPYLSSDEVQPQVPEARAAKTEAAAAKSKAAKPTAGELVRWLKSLRERQGGVRTKFPSTSERKLIRRSLADSCSGVSRHLAARAIGLFAADSRYRGEAARFREQIEQTRKSYPKLSRRLSKKAFARVLARSPWYRAHGEVLERLQSTQSMLGSSKGRLGTYNREVLPGQLRRIGTAHGRLTKAEFHAFTDRSYRRKNLRAALATGAPVVIGLAAFYKAAATKKDPEPKAKWHENCHYVVAIKIPGKKRVMIIDPWPGAKNGGVSFQDLSKLRMPGTYGGKKVRLGTRFGYFRNAVTQKALVVRPPKTSSGAVR